MAKTDNSKVRHLSPPVDAADQDNDTEYQAERFLVKATDAKGHSVRVWCSCQPGHARQLDRFLASKKFPYRTKGDIIRHAIYRHLYWLQSLPGKQIPSVMSEVDAILDIMSDEQFASDLRLVFDRLGVRINEHVGKGCFEEAARLLLQVRARVDQMPECHWRREYVKELAKYDHVLNAVPRGKLSKLVDEE